MKAPDKREIAAVFTEACKHALNNLPFDVRCLDWASYTPNFFIEQQEQFERKAA